MFRCRTFRTLALTIVLVGKAWCDDLRRRGKAYMIKCVDCLRNHHMKATLERVQIDA